MHAGRLLALLILRPVLRGYGRPVRRRGRCRGHACMAVSTAGQSGCPVSCGFTWLASRCHLVCAAAAWRRRRRSALPAVASAAARAGSWFHACTYASSWRRRSGSGICSLVAVVAVRSSHRSAGSAAMIRATSFAATGTGQVGDALVDHRVGHRSGRVQRVGERGGAVPVQQVGWVGAFVEPGSQRVDAVRGELPVVAFGGDVSG